MTFSNLAIPLSKIIREGRDSRWVEDIGIHVQPQHTFFRCAHHLKLSVLNWRVSYTYSLYDSLINENE